MVTNPTAEAIAEATQSLVKTYPQLFARPAPVPTEEENLASAKKQFTDICAAMGERTPSELPTATTNSVTPDAIDRLNRIQDLTSLIGDNSFVKDIFELCTFCTSLIFERSQIEDEMKTWRKRFEEMAIYALRNEQQNSRMNLAFRNGNLVGKAPLF